MHARSMRLGFLLFACAIWSYPARAQIEMIHYTVTIPPHTVACFPFELSDDDDDAATKIIDSARKSWADAAFRAKIDKVGFLFVFDRDRERKKESYPIALSLCGTVAREPNVPTQLTFIKFKETKGQILHCSSISVEACMKTIQDKIPAAADTLPIFPRYSFWTRKSAPVDEAEAIEGLIGPLIPVQARMAGEVSAPQPDSGEPQLRPLGGSKFEPCASTAAGCPSPEGPGDPSAVLLLLPDQIP